MAREHTHSEDMSQKHRIQLDFSDEAYNTLQSLKKRMNASTNAEVIRQALGILKWVVKEVGEDKRILVEGEDELKELIVPFIISKEK